MTQTSHKTLTLEEIEAALRDMAYNGGPFTYYGVLEKLRELAEKKQ